MSTPDRSIRAMRAAVLHSHGAVPEVEELRNPEPEPGAELLEVQAAAMNPIDVRIASGAFPRERYEPPYVAGKEGIGRRPDGSLVYFDFSRKPFGAFAERTLIDEDAGYPVPDGLDPALAVCLGVSGLAAWLSLEWRGRLAEGETVLVLGATGVVGQIAVQAAKLLGAGRVVAAGRDQAVLERARSLGADELVRLGGEDVASALRSAAGGDGFDLVLDPLWGEPAVAALGAVKPFGRVVNMGQSADAEATLTSAAVRNTPIDLLGYTNYTAGEDRKAAAYQRMAEHALAGRLRVDVQQLGLDDVPDAWQRQGSSPHAKLVIVP
jgi:NADPH:quinone reductase-like Zn-dependent oxidoreductase